MRLLVLSFETTTAFLALLSSQQRLSSTLLCFRCASSMLSLRLTFLTLGVYTLSAVKAFCLLQSRGLGPSSASFLALQNGGKTTLRRRCSVAMQVNPREDADFEMTVDWDEELRKLNAAQYTKKRAERAKKEAEPDVMKWAKTSTRKAQSAAQETSFKVRGAMNDSPRWRQLSQDYRFWLGLVAGISLLASILSATSRNQDLVVWNDALGEGTDGDVYTLAYAAFVAAQTAHVAGDTAAQLAETGATMVFA